MLYRKIPISVISIKKIVKNILKEEKVKKAFLTIVLVQDAMIRRLNRKYMSKDLSTDVLSFDLVHPFSSKMGIVGDVVVCVDTAAAVAKKIKVTFEEELMRYIVHGILHLIGYDDSSLVEKKKMWKRQEELLKRCLGRRA
ncbi:MAG: rRNA maturation RNase YbeY [Candidatus Omnitrophica bacterium]|nr:rRNA maturation RNase YbeY [Candidatus Omnitrophota bacterium]